MHSLADIMRGGHAFFLSCFLLTFKLTRTWLSHRIDGSEPRKTSRNEKDQSNTLRQRRSFCSFSAFCSFYESPDDVSWAWDESPWPVPALFHAVVAGEHAAPHWAKAVAQPLPLPPPSPPQTRSPPATTTPLPTAH